MVVLYYHSFDAQKAKDNCEFKSITVCKGSCYVTKQIKVVSSSTNKETEHPQQIDLSSLKDVIGISTKLEVFIPHVFVHAVEWDVFYNDHYYYQPTNHLIKPPIV